MKLLFSLSGDMNKQAIAHIKKFRKDKGWTQKDIAKRLGISQARIAYIESGKSSITLSTLQEIFSL